MVSTTSPASNQVAAIPAAPAASATIAALLVGGYWTAAQPITPPHTFVEVVFHFRGIRRVLYYVGPPATNGLADAAARKVGRSMRELGGKWRIVIYRDMVYVTGE